MSPAPSLWNSPVPYLFGGLAAMLGLIALALLILACSYWRLAGQLDERERRSETDLESGGEGKDTSDSESKVPKVYEEKILVIMAGDEKPTFLATPVCAKAATCGDGNVEKGDQKKKGDKADNFETTIKEVDDQDEDTRTEENKVISNSQETPEAQGHNQ
ncbi:hypothetical protein I3843_08G004300 [Carya illinoinensis]|uniref:Uncharacterized protein n=1 Tax=Carya illinoinensis TaxID=32201 RepID=A0A922J9K9_CARIL|nr:hypothetical protein I3760_08G003900 [Carya illinoinensis]KAG6698077.1 hypothetical protein I3842_08G003900 [Carya illinoinensis]KAG7965488.1 hypothetical protein I3843_08G004300 [Carya illinoinensis]